jgi:hypothetical protein
MAPRFIGGKLASIPDRLGSSAAHAAGAGNAFERALLLDSLLRAQGGARSCRVDALVEHLVAEQLPDGSWRSAPVLRVTHRECASPWERTDAGSLYADPRRLFTSATVLSALCRFTYGEQR